MTIRHASEWASGEPGIFAGVPNSEYHAAPGVSSSHLKRLAISPAHAKLPLEVSDASRKAMDLGTLAHGLVLEKKDASALGYVVRPEGISLTTKAGREWREANPGPMVDAEQVATAKAIAEAVCGSWIPNEITEATHFELSLRAVDPATGLTLKARFDALLGGCVFDLKTCRDSSPDAFGRDCEDREYLVQAAHYMHVARLAGIEADEFRFVAVSTLPPYEVGTYEFGDAHPAFGPARDAHARLLDLHRRCTEANAWPKRDHGMQPLTLPKWSKYLP